jgi:hypothetical protein
MLTVTGALAPGAESRRKTGGLLYLFGLLYRPVPEVVVALQMRLAGGGFLSSCPLSRPVRHICRRIA